MARDHRRKLDGSAATGWSDGATAIADHPLHVTPVLRPARPGDADEIDGRFADVPKGTRAVVYLRVSSSRQVQTDYDPEGISIPAQRLACERKAQQLGFTIVEEYVEPGRSATEMTKRVAFQQMLERIRRQKDVDAVIVYKLSRFARNRNDDAIVMADLHKRGITLISATESIDETPVGQLMHGILAAFNEFRSREDGADISYEMGEKAKRGGTIGKAPIGYLNTIERFDGRDLRSVSVDEERVEFVRLAFELYADGEHSFEDIVDELTDRGLTARATGRWPAGPISTSKLAAMLRDEYYLGRISYKGGVYEGRHPAIIDEALFERVQALLDFRGVAGERRRVYDHYLKGTLWCGHCYRERGIRTNRMLIQRTIGSPGGEYFYFFCSGKQQGTCQTRFVPVRTLEDLVADHYQTVRFVPEFIAMARRLLTSSIEDQTKAQQLHRKHLEGKRRALQVKADNLIDLAAEGGLTGERVRAKLREIEKQSEDIRKQLEGIVDDLSEGVRILEGWIALLDHPRELYLNASDETRRRLNQAIFKRIFVCEDEVVGHELNEPVAELMSAQEMFSRQRLISEAELETQWQSMVDVSAPASTNRRALTDDLLAAMYPVEGLSKPSLVPLEAVELEVRPHDEAAERPDARNDADLGSRSSAPITPLLVRLQSKCSHERLLRFRSLPARVRSSRPFDVHSGWARGDGRLTEPVTRPRDGGCARTALMQMCSVKILPLPRCQLLKQLYRIGGNEVLHVAHCLRNEVKF